METKGLQVNKYITLIWKSMICVVPLLDKATKLCNVEDILISKMREKNMWAWLLNLIKNCFVYAMA